MGKTEAGSSGRIRAGDLAAREHCFTSEFSFKLLHFWGLVHLFKGTSRLAPFHWLPPGIISARITC